MRTNIDIPDDLMDAAMKAGAYKTKKEAVEAGLKLVARQEVYREILKWRGKLHWDGEAWADEAPKPVTDPSTTPPCADPTAGTPSKPSRGRR